MKGMQYAEYAGQLTLAGTLSGVGFEWKPASYSSSYIGSAETEATITLPKTNNLVMMLCMVGGEKTVDLEGGM